MHRRLAASIASGLGTGYLRPAPGTWGSLLALPIGWLAYTAGGALAVLTLGLLCAVLGWLACRALPEQQDDPSWIIIDEIAGQLLALAVLVPSFLGYALAFALFRLLDIAKPFPVGWLDKNLKGAGGIMADDLAAGIMAAVLLALLGVWLPI